MTELPIGKVIRNLREHAGMSQPHVAAKMNSFRTYISKVERGCSTPTLEMLCRFADALEIPVWELVYKVKLVADGVLVLKPVAKPEKVAPAKPVRAIKPAPPTPPCVRCDGERKPGRVKLCDVCREDGGDLRCNKPLMEIEARAEVPEHVREMRREYDRLMARGKFRDAERVRQQMMQGGGYQIPARLDQQFQRVSA